MTLGRYLHGAGQQGERWHSAVLQRRMLAWGSPPEEARVSARIMGSVG